VRWCEPRVINLREAGTQTLVHVLARTKSAEQLFVLFDFLLVCRQERFGESVRGVGREIDLERGRGGST
jgi:hypothetical protein